MLGAAILKHEVHFTSRSWGQLELVSVPVDFPPDFPVRISQFQVQLERRVKPFLSIIGILFL